MKEMIKKMNVCGARMVFRTGATAAEIERFEKNHAVRLPEDYRQLLMYSDGGELFAPGFSFYGVKEDTWNLAKENSAKNREPYDLPADLYIFGTQNYGDPVCFDLDTYEVVQWDHETQSGACAWDSLQDFLGDMIAELA